MEQAQKYLKKHMKQKNEQSESRLTYIRYKDKYPLELKGNMKRKPKIVKESKQINLGSIRTYKSQRDLNKSEGLLGAILQNSTTGPLIKQKKHYVATPKLSQNPEFYFRYDNKNKKPINFSQFSKIKQDIEDHLPIQDSSSLPRSSSMGTINSFHSGKKINYRHNMFQQSQMIGQEQSKYSMRRPNPWRSSSSIKLG